MQTINIGSEFEMEFVLKECCINIEEIQIKTDDDWMRGMYYQQGVILQNSAKTILWKFGLCFIL